MEREVERVFSHSGHQREPRGAARTARQNILGGLTLRELAEKTWRGANEDDAFGRAAELAFYFFSIADLSDQRLGLYAERAGQTG